jgi:hypothetical protein
LPKLATNNPGSRWMWSLSGNYAMWAPRDKVNSPALKASGQIMPEKSRCLWTWAPGKWAGRNRRHHHFARLPLGCLSLLCHCLLDHVQKPTTHVTDPALHNVACDPWSIGQVSLSKKMRAFSHRWLHDGFRRLSLSVKQLLIL